MAGDAVLAIDRSITGGTGFTVVVTEAVLLAWLLSVSLPATEAVLVIVPAVVGVTTTVIVSVAPGARLPMSSVRTPPVGVSVAPLVLSVAETNVALAGSVSPSVTPVAPLVASLL